MELIKPKRKCINIFNRDGEPDLMINFYYTSNEDTQKPKRTYRISMRNFFYRNNIKWQYICFGIEYGSVVFFEGDKSNGYRFDSNKYICNMSLIETICDVYKIKIKDKAFRVSFKCDKVNDKLWRMIIEK
jgi:hypothetical protein